MTSIMGGDYKQPPVEAIVCYDEDESEHCSLSRKNKLSFIEKNDLDNETLAV